MVKKTEPLEAPNPNDLLNKFLEKNNMKLSVAALDQENPYISGVGYALTSKPLLVVKAEYREVAASV